MYDLWEVEAYKPKGNYKIDADAYRDGGKSELIAALDAIETTKSRKMWAIHHLIKITFTSLVASLKQLPSWRTVLSR